MSTWWPDTYALGGASALLLVLALCVGLGALLPRRASLEVQLLAGWGLACLVLTLWGVATGASLRWPLGALGAAGLAGLVLPGPRARIAGGRAVWRVGVLSLPVFAVMLAARPSQIDTWLNLLPNAAYLFFHNQFPTAARAPSYSFLPVAPYNTQFIAYATSVLAGQFADRAMGLFNLILQCTAGVALARVLAGRGGRVAWWQAACGMALAVPLNPGFVPRVFLAPYGEAPLAVALLFAVLQGTELLAALAEGGFLAGLVARLGLILVAVLNTKQSGIGLVLPVGATLGLLVLIHPGVPRWRGVLAVVAAMLPALVLYGVWGHFAAHAFVAGALQVMPVSQWNFALIPEILAAAGHEVIEKATFYLCLLGMIAAGIVCQRRAPFGAEARMLLLGTGITLGFNAFLIVAYITAFDPWMARQAHSYFRYSTQLSMMVMLGLTLALRPLAGQWAMLLGAVARGRLQQAAVGLILILPLAGAPMLRFDRETPQRELWALGHAAALLVPDGAHLAVVVPGDGSDGVGSFLRGVMLFTPPARPHLVLRTETKADPAMLAALHAAGFQRALVSCMPADLVPGVPGGVAALLRYYDKAWHVQARWEYPPGLAHQHFAGLLARAPLCAGG